MERIENFILNYYSLSSSSLFEFQNILIQKEYKKNDVLYRRGEVPSRFFLLVEGVARSVVIDKKGVERTQMIFNAPDIFASFVSTLNSKPSTIEFNCLTDTVIFEGSFSKFLELTKKYHDLSILYSRFLEDTFIKIDDKLTSISTMNATERYLYLRQQIPDIERLIQLNHIASFLNITPIQLSRIRRQLSKIGRLT